MLNGPPTPSLLSMTQIPTPVAQRHRMELRHMIKHLLLLQILALWLKPAIPSAAGIRQLMGVVVTMTLAVDHLLSPPLQP